MNDFIAVFCSFAQWFSMEHENQNSNPNWKYIKRSKNIQHRSNTQWLKVIHERVCLLCTMNLFLTSCMYASWWSAWSTSTQLFFIVESFKRLWLALMSYFFILNLEGSLVHLAVICFPKAVLIFNPDVNNVCWERISLI